MMSLTGTVKVFASDWDVAGKVLTGIAGLRVITGGKVDLIGGITGINKNRYVSSKKYRNQSKNHEYCQQEWVPYYSWEREWIPTHSEYSKKKGEIIVEGHYIKYKVTNNGHWQTNHRCR
ncbi:MAG: hypothetical protein K9L86_05275 [Candidatus Omnitrophica bacterium]|nr:hypothetical protein [Candidatus Omnitrophota bacterium]